MRPLLLYDGNCAFCRRWVGHWRARTGGAVSYRPSRLARRAVQLIDSDGRRHQGADAVFRALGRAPRMRLVAAIARLPFVRWMARRAYRFIAAHRTSAGRVDRLLFGRSTAPPTRRVVRWLFLRCLGGVYLIAFTSLRGQVLGLYGTRGIEPIGKLLAQLRARAGRDAYRFAPTLLWLGSSDRDLVRLCQAGQLCAVALVLDVAPRTMVAALWALYLSFVSVGRDFLSFQWDALLLETGLHATLISAPANGRDRQQGAPPWLGALLMRWLVFRLHFQSGLVKLRSRDRSWRRCTACAYHYETQPLPTPLGWYASQLPRPIHRLSTAAALAIELGAPPLVFAPRRVRKAAFAALTGLQLIIAATGNYAFFNLLTIALGLWALDDASFRRLGRAAGLGARGRGRGQRRRRATPAWLRVPLRVAQTALAALVAVVSAATFTRRLSDRPLARAAARLGELVEPARSINPYGLFAVMTTERPEIVVEGSNDGDTWREYRFRYKPSRPEDPPRWVAPHQPRLDWQMWFAALGSPPPWFAAFVARLLQGSPDVLGLLADNPFPDHPPRYVRALLYDYRMTDRETRKRTGAWWRRRLVETYFPMSSLREA